jgi:hypothetical protein
MRSYLKEKVAAPAYKTGITAVGAHGADHSIPLYLQKVAVKIGQPAAFAQSA